jgi:DNA repair exonuclease SbcCD ATPase subunit
MKIISFRAENVKRLTAVSITPDGNVVEITGKNGAGKTSVLDSIWWALRGGKTIQDVPIRKGAETAFIELDLGRFKVTRKFKDKEGKVATSLIVETEDGIKASEPQKILDKLYGALTFDPLAFTRQPPKDQFDTLKQFVPGVDFAAIAEANDKDFAERTDVNRKAKELRVRISAISVPETTGQEPVDEAALVSELAGAGEFNTAIERDRGIRQQQVIQIARQTETVATLRQRATDLRREADAADAEAAAMEVHASESQAALEALPPLAEPRDTADLQNKIAEARNLNAALDAAARAAQTVADLTAQAVAEEAKSDALTTAMEKRTAEKEKAVAAAELPVSGITFGDGAIMLNGVPFDQASDAEQLRASIELAAAMNPKLRIIRVRDGSLLDADSMKLLEEMAEKSDMQIWVETVSSGRAGAVVIEDGHVAGAVAQQAAE